MIGFIVASSGGSFCAHKLLKLFLNKLVSSIEFIQIIVHVGLVDCNAAARVESYLHYLNEVVSFALFDPAGEIYEATEL